MHLLCVASLVPRKGHDLLLDALARLRDLPWRLTCVGSLDLDPADGGGDPRHRPRTRARRPDHVRRRRAERRARAAYDAADVFVLPTRYEGYGMAVAEAVARGLPVVELATPARIPDLVDERSGVLVPPGGTRAAGPRRSTG